jgi:V8-like Glu-specific endopeptidase
MTATGFLIGSDLVLTVAHNIYSRSNKKRFDNLLFYPGVSGDLANLTPLKVVDVRYPREY